jgi:hypothetical protein
MLWLDPMDHSKGFRWPWCFTHDAPMVAEKDRMVCYWEGQSGIRPLDGCQASTVEVRHTFEPFDLTGYNRERVI